MKSLEGRLSAAKFTAKRNLLGITLDALALELGVNPRTVRSWGEGREPVPKSASDGLAKLRRLHDADLEDIIATPGPVLLPRSRDNDKGRRPRGWWAGIAARIEALDPDRAIEWDQELAPIGQLLEDVLLATGITKVLRIPKTAKPAVHLPFLRIQCRNVLGIISQPPLNQQESELWQEENLHTGQLKMMASNTSWNRWIQQHANQIPDGWEPTKVIPNPHRRGAQHLTRTLKAS